MRTRRPTRFNSRLRPKAGTKASARTVLVVLVAFALGGGLGAYWFHRSKPAPDSASHTEPGAQLALSESTRAVLNRLNSPVEVRFYSLLEPANTPDATKAFAQRADRILEQYVQEASGKLKLTRFASMSQANANAALADGLKAFNLGNGDSGYLGVALSLKGQKESVAQLSPEWEPALESDLTRAIARLLDATRPATASGANSQADTAALEAVKALIPDVSAVSLEAGTQILRESALKQFQAAAKEMEAEVKEAQQQVADAQNGKSEAELQAALQHLRQVQVQQNDKLKEIAAQAQAQVQALQGLKAKP